MPIRKHIRSGEKLPLKLTAAQKTLVLEGLTCLDSDIERIIRDTPSGQPVKMTLDDLDDFGGFVAAEANHCEDKSKAKKLDTIFEKIQDLLETYTDDEPPQTVKIEEARKDRVASGDAALIAVVGAESPKKAAGKTKRRPKQPTDILYQFKITLLGIKPPIWRRIQVQDCTLDKLHEHIQTAMGWTNSHLHDFEIKGKRYGDPELIVDGFEDLEYADSRSTMVSEVLPTAGRRFAFKYQYDFGDSWDHEILFEGCPTADPKTKYPLCLEGERACPPEDCGGVWGYPQFLEAIADPKHEEHESMLQWIGGEFDAEKFNAKKATKEMKKGLPDWRLMDDGF
jgi:hypothetical protein